MHTWRIITSQDIIFSLWNEKYRGSTKRENWRLARITAWYIHLSFIRHMLTASRLESWRNTLLLSSLELIWVPFIGLLHVFGSICQKAGGGSWASWVGGTKYGVWEMLSDVSQFCYMCKHSGNFTVISIKAGVNVSFQTPTFVYRVFQPSHKNVCWICTRGCW